MNFGITLFLTEVVVSYLKNNKQLPLFYYLFLSANKPEDHKQN